MASFLIFLGHNVAKIWYIIQRTVKIVSLRSKKAGRFENSLVLLGVTQLWHVAQWASRAPPDHTLPAFLNLNGSFRPCSTSWIFYILQILFSNMHKKLLVWWEQQCSKIQKQEANGWIQLVFLNKINWRS